TDAGKTWLAAPILLTAADSREGNLVIDTYNGNLYTAFVPASATNRIDVLRSTDGGTTWNTTVGAYTGPAGTSPNNAFVNLAVDRGGNVHMAFSQCTTGAQRTNCHIFLTSSSNSGVTWQPAVQVDN